MTQVWETSRSQITEPVITKGYEVRATTIEGQTLFLKRCALRMFHVIGNQNTRD